MKKIETEEKREEQIGILIGATETETATMNSVGRVKKFQSVLIEDKLDGITKYILARVDKARTSSRAASANVGFDPSTIPDHESIRERMEAASEDVRDRGYEGILKIEGYLDYLKQGKIVLPDTAPDPFSRVLRPGLTDLKAVYCPDDYRFNRFASLVYEPNVAVGFNHNEIVHSRLGIFGISGNGKTTLVLNILKSIAQLGGTAVVLDTQGDYTTLANSDFADSLNLIDAKIAISELSAEELASLFGIAKHAGNQFTVFKFAFDHTMTNLEYEQYWDLFYHNLKLASDKVDKTGASRTDKKLEEAADRVEERCLKFSRVLRNILHYGASDVRSEIKTDMINVINLTRVNDDELDRAAAYYLRQLFQERKDREQLQAEDNNGDNNDNDHEYGTLGGEFPAPMVIVLEEAHDLLPVEKREITKRTTKIATQIAKQGRKYHVGLILSSQQPTKIDDHILSQLSSYAIGRLKNDTDIDYVLKASPSLSRDLVIHAPSLSIGQFICVGPAFNVTAFVQVDEFTNRKIGGNLDCAKIWMERKARRAAKEHDKKIENDIKSRSRDKSDTYVPDGYIQEDE